MIEITVKVEGMKCPMCEAHVNEAIKGAFDVKSVASSHDTGETVIMANSDINDELITETIEKAGFKVIGVSKKECEKKGFFSKLFGKKGN